MRQAIAAFGVAVGLAASPLAQGTKPAGGVALADLSWVDAEPVLTASSVVVIPLGAGVLEQGPHLKLNSDERLARYLGARVQTAASVVMAPPLTYHFYPAFLEYPGSASLTQATARAMTVEVVRSFARYGPRRFYVLNTAPDAVRPLSEAAKTLAEAGILLGYTDPRFRLQRPPVQLRQAPITVAHADEVATSMMLFVDPAAVDMTRAAREYGRGSGPLTRLDGGPGVLSRSGVLGDATVATREKGQVLIETLLAGVLEDIEAVRSAVLPAAKPATSPTAEPTPAPSRPATPSSERVMPGGCTAGQERDIRLLGPRFSALWREMDAEKIGEMFAGAGDIRHPDGTIERGVEVIRQNRQELFRKKEYRGSVHPLQLNDIRCPVAGVAIADGKWELRLADPPGTKPYAGWCTLVLRGSGAGWSIEAWRYTVDPPPNTTPAPTILKKPGWPGGPGGE
jgi:creatinine amidohydrolase